MSKGERTVEEYGMSVELYDASFLLIPVSGQNNSLDHDNSHSVRHELCDLWREIVQFCVKMLCQDIGLDKYSFCDRSSNCNEIM